MGDVAAGSEGGASHLPGDQGQQGDRVAAEMKERGEAGGKGGKNPGCLAEPGSPPTSAGTPLLHRP